MSFRRRIALSVVALLAAGCILFSAISLAVLDRTLRTQSDAKLNTFALAVGQIVDNHDGHLSLDADDKSQIAMLHGPEEHFAVLEPDGRVVFGEAPPDAAQRSGYRFARTTHIHENGRGTILTWQSDRWLADVRRASLLTFAIVSAILIAAAALLSRALANALLDPVERVAQLAEQIEARDLSRRIEAQGNDELSRFCASFDRMLDRLEASFETERRFVADASHELRTPLAIIRAETDLAMRRPREPEEYCSALASIHGETARLELLVDDLLDTMRDRAIELNERVDVAAVVNRVAGRMRAATREMQVAVAGQAALVRGHGASLERATSAVVHNAITHGGAGTIGIHVGVDKAWVRIDVKDDGPGFAAEALANATERFWRADSARSRGGTGLGLSIARVLIEAHGGQLCLANAPGGGAVVSFFLPAN